MEVIDLTEHEDGSATVVLDVTEQEKSLLIQVGFVQVLKDSIAAEKARELLQKEQ